MNIVAFGIKILDFEKHSDHTRNMFRLAFFLLFVFVPFINCQLIIGLCPEIEHVKNLDFKRYSGQWHVIAQSKFHPMKAVNCQRVTYAPYRNGMTASFSTSKNYESDQPYKNGTLKSEGPNKGELLLSLNNFPRRYHFRVLHVDYPKLAVEYTCMDGAARYLATISVLHRDPVHLTDIDSGFRALNVTSLIPADLKDSLRLVSHTNCIN
ncbi:uncharacterized protein NPIL_476412 [Nephila pilipes]|uniref:Lipocalin/cytosolic fatty-acid binding domain-containing protein n=1 Tax=Nephila pilipes TaxID=299642 RepID=A0A8X6U980_NEPPI|nr:uncharacterized protein NPIL_476412 [Nephila pilipes]